MASGPQSIPNDPDQPSQSPIDQPASSQSPPHSAASMNSEDTDTVLIDKPDRDRQDPDDAARPPPLSRSSTFGIKKCWICIGDSTEDDPNNPPTWRSPCSCNLTAHEECLLDWVADLENPKGKTKPPQTIRCPQCKSEIKISRPKELLVEATRAVDRVLGNLVLPGLGLAVGGTIFAGSWVHGWWAVNTVFGDDQALDIIREASNHSGWIYTYALIPWNLIFARTSYSDFVLPSGTLFLLQTQLSDGLRIDMTMWPPLPSTVFVCLPALRSFYAFCYKRAFGGWNKRWLEEMQPRQVLDAANQEENIADIANREAEEAAAEGGIVVELNIGGGIGEERQEDGREGEDNQDGQQGENNEGDNNNRRILGERGEEIIDVGAGFGSTILGAIAFPAVAAWSGQLLSYAIPSWWMTDANFTRGRPGLLRHKWGRTVVGGCLFVVLKDALVLYCRWRLAQSHRQRKIMDYDKKTKKYSV